MLSLYSNPLLVIMIVANLCEVLTQCSLCNSMAAHDDDVSNDLANLQGELAADDQEVKYDQASLDLSQASGTQVANAKRALTSCNTLRKCKFGRLTVHQKKTLKDEEHWKGVAQNFTSKKDLNKYGKSRKNKQGKVIGCCGHLCIHGELHWFCHKCQVFSGFPPCCQSLDYDSLCPTGKLMTEKALKIRATYIEKAINNKNDGIVPDWRIHKYPAEDEFNGGASTSTQETKAKPVKKTTNGSTAMDTQDQNNNNTNQESDDESMQADDELQATTERVGERKPFPASTDCMPIIDRGDAGCYKEVMAELRQLGAPSVMLQPSADVIHYGVALDDTWLDMIEQRLQELRTLWTDPAYDVDSMPYSEVLHVDAAPFDKEGDPLVIAPLGFPAVERLGVALRSFSGESLVRLTQQDLAGWEEQLKFILHSLSFVKTLHATAVRTHHKELEERNTQRNEETIPKARRTTRASTGSGQATPTLESYPLAHVDEAATTALDDTAKVVVNCLVDIVVARRRAVTVKAATRQEKIAILTRTITNTNELA